MHLKNNPCPQLLVSGIEDMLLEFEAIQKKSDQKLRKMEKRALLTERQRDDALEKTIEFRLKFYPGCGEYPASKHKRRRRDESAPV